MPRKKHSAEEIISKLREAEVLLAQGRKVPEVSRILGVTEQTYFRWRKEYGGLKMDQAKRFKELERENARLKRAVHPERSRVGKLLSAARRRHYVHHVREMLGVSERRACRVLGQARSTQRHVAKVPDDEAALTKAIIDLASQFGRYGYRRITVLLRAQGWHVNAKRVARIWRQERLKVPTRQPKRGRLWLNDGSCIRLRPCWRDDGQRLEVSRRGFFQDAGGDRRV